MRPLEEINDWIIRLNEAFTGATLHGYAAIQLKSHPEFYALFHMPEPGKIEFLRLEKSEDFQKSLPHS